ncbi:hypothetical protein ABZ154_22030 [Streptomyces sp. NPDC006261]|uniref:hypothetical protein n=1 Tax=Streptomyces sp. NPDC006261 TaxID=3156739 RepID=UPI0033BD1560
MTAGPATEVDKVGRFLAAVGRGVGPDWDVRVAEYNGGPAVACFVGGKPDSFCRIEVRDGAMQSVYIVRDPYKLAGLSAV